MELLAQMLAIQNIRIDMVIHCNFDVEIFIPKRPSNGNSFRALNETEIGIDERFVL